MDMERDPKRIHRFFEVNPDAPRIPTSKAYVSFWIGPEIPEVDPQCYQDRILEALRWIRINYHPLSPMIESETESEYKTRVANLILRLYWIYEPYAPTEMRDAMDRLVEVTELEYDTMKALSATNESKYYSPK
jgi:hypothetical protein